MSVDEPDCRNLTGCRLRRPLRPCWSNSRRKCELAPRHERTYGLRGRKCPTGDVLRFSCILNIYGGRQFGVPRSDRISDHSVKRAAGLVEGYFLLMAERALGDAAIPVLERRAMTLAQHLRKTAALSFNARDVRRTIGGELREPAHMDAACKTLEEAGLIRPARASEAIGRRPKNYEVNPSIFGSQS